MPNNLDFTNINDIKIIEINITGWINPLEIEYGISEKIPAYKGITCYCWRVKGTLHTFVIPISRLDFISSGNYEKHFSNVLEIFREDYLKWKEEGFIYDWSREYKKQFSKFIVI